MLPQASSSSGSEKKQQVVQAYDGHPTYSCSKCSAVISLQDELISKAFSGRDGRGFLMQSAVNVKMGKREDRSLMYLLLHSSCSPLFASHLAVRRSLSKKMRAAVRRQP
ncbi:hypothetical protein DFP72DRAFT_1000682 [Ephemerocybe angulata]|uniref:Yippee domain-containing protein n=1 Tax=Ephemerocybe angulata TaxID=980116 RepID=A0A8H6MBM8_9AGAR|nr:hypothetical protein DFP72DRAFT_1000682 [Tulosesus angulatus]